MHVHRAVHSKSPEEPRMTLTRTHSKRIKFQLHKNAHTDLKSMLSVKVCNLNVKQFSNLMNKQPNRSDLSNNKTNILVEMTKQKQRQKIIRLSLKESDIDQYKHNSKKCFTPVALNNKFIYSYKSKQKFIQRKQDEQRGYKQRRISLLAALLEPCHIAPIALSSRPLTAKNTYRDLSNEKRTYSSLSKYSNEKRSKTMADRPNRVTQLSGWEFMDESIFH